MTGSVQQGISFRHFTDTAFPRRLQFENTRDLYHFNLPLARGNATVRQGGRVVHEGEVRPGMLRVLSPGDVVEVTRQSAHDMAILAIPGQLFRRISVEHGRTLGHGDGVAIEPLPSPNPLFARMGRTLCAAADIDMAHRDLFIEGVTMSLIAASFSRSVDGANRRTSGFDEAQTARCIAYADAHIGTHLDLESWAAALDMTASEFSRRFQQTMHNAPYAWFLEWRIDRAKTMLLSTDISLASVAFQTGFSSQSHFTEAFRRRVGVSPGRWRRNSDE